MTRILLTLTVIVAGLSMMAPDINAQSGYNPPPATARQKRHDAWQKDMAEFRARSEHDRMLHALADSLASVQAAAAIKNQDFVLEAQSITFKNGANTFVNSNTNFIAVKGNRAVVQISPSNFASGPNGVGGVTVDGMITDRSITRDKRGNLNYSMNVMGVGINAQVEIYMYPNTNGATAVVYPNFNSNTVWMQGNIVPYENSNVIEGSSL